MRRLIDGSDTMTDASKVPSTADRRLVSLVLPVYNERDSLRPLYDKLCQVIAAQHDDYELVFIDDGSTDGSFDVLASLHERDPRVRVVQFRRNFGKAAAYNAGFEAARGQLIITLDTDLQDDPAEIPLFVQKIDAGFDLVVGWKHEGKGPINKSFPSRFFNWVVRRLTGIQLHDFNCPFKAYRGEVLREIQVYGELHRYIPVLASAKGFSLTEVPISNLPRRHGKSHYGVERYLRGMLDLLTVIFITRFSKRPAHLLALGGIISGLVGVGILVALTVGHFMYRLNFTQDRGWNLHDRPALSLGILLIIVGIQFLATGLLGELLVIGSSRAGQDKGYSVHRTLDEPRTERPSADG